MAERSNDSPGISTVKFDPTRVTELVKIDLRDNIEGLGDIRKEYRPTVYAAALGAILAGGDLGALSKALLSCGVNVRRAGEICRYLSSNAAALMEAERREQLGVKYAIWQYSGAPCGNTKQDSAHKAAHGQRFPVTEGLHLNGRFTLPGRELGCRCSSSAVIPGFTDNVAGGSR